MKTHQKILLCFIPLYLVADIYLLSHVFDLLSQKNDIAVAMGVILFCTLIIGNYFLINYLLTFKTNKTDENKN